MATRTAAPCAVLVLRLLTLALLAASLAIIAADKFTDDSVPGVPPQKYTFKDVYAYRYLLAVAVIGCTYVLLQLPLAALSVARRKQRVVEADAALVLAFADVAAALLLATGAAAALGLTCDAKRYLDRLLDGVQAPALARLHRDADRFLALASASAGLMLAAAAAVGGTVMVSVYSLVK